MSAEVADILLQAKNNLIDLGAVAGKLVNSSGCVCALGAIYLAEGIIERVQFGQWYDGWGYKVVNGDNPDWDYPDTPAVIALADVISSPILSTASASVYRWNDRLVPGRLSSLLEGFDAAIAAQQSTE